MSTISRTIHTKFGRVHIGVNSGFEISLYASQESSYTMAYLSTDDARKVARALMSYADLIDGENE